MTPASYWKQVREACDKATPGPWRTLKDSGTPWNIEGNGKDVAMTSQVERTVTGQPERTANAEFIALSRTALPLALARIEELEAALDQISDSFVTSLEATELTAIARAALGKP
jgi:hypothetical protein